MKKTFIALMTIAALAACNKAEVIETAKGDAITFGEAFVDNATKADYSTDMSLAKFQVWGTVTGNGNTVNLYNGAEVTGTVGDAVWDCTQTEYWVPSCSYSFIAIADATSVTAPDAQKNMPTEIGYTVAAKKDLLIATATATTDENATPDPAGPVAFTFSHLLSKVLFSFEYGVVDNAKYKFNITDVTISGLTEKGKYTVNNGKWAADGSTTTSLSFGAGSANVTPSADAASAASHQILPLTQTLTVTVTYDIIYNDVTIMKGETQTGTLTQEFAKATVYSINVKMPAPGAAIEFRVTSVGGFSDGSTIPLQ